MSKYEIPMPKYELSTVEMNVNHTDNDTPFKRFKLSKIEKHVYTFDLFKDEVLDILNILQKVRKLSDFIGQRITELEIQSKPLKISLSLNMDLFDFKTQTNEELKENFEKQMEGNEIAIIHITKIIVTYLFPVKKEKREIRKPYVGL
jgi:hypothetical protein